MAIGFEPQKTYAEFLQALIAKTGGVKNLTERQLENLAKVKVEMLRSQRNAPILYYKPYESAVYPGRFPQDDFHRSEAKIRLVTGGNRSGKSECGIIEAIWHALGTHPYKKIKTPNSGWIVSLDFPTSRDVAEQKLRRWLPPYEIKKWDEQERNVYLRNGSVIGLKSCDQDVNKFGGSAKHWIYFDEEPTGERGYRIYQECLMRTIDFRGKVWFTMTPVLGMSWSFDELYERAAYDKDIFVVSIETYENPFLNRDEIDNMAKKFSKEELDMRLKGKYIQFSGLVFKELDKNVHFIEPFHIPKDWPKFRSIDHGIRNPTACLWGAVNDKEELYIYDEYYETDKTIAENCEAIRTITAGDSIEWTTIDPSTEQRDPQTGISNRSEYLRNGILTRALRTDKKAGINLIKQLLRSDDETKRPRLFIFNTCYNLIREMTRYRYKSLGGRSEESGSDDPVKVLDHAIDALRYMVSSKVRYLIEDEEETQKPLIWYSGQ